MALPRVSITAVGVALSVLLGLGLIIVINLLLNMVFGLGVLKLGNVLLGFLLLVSAGGIAFMVVIKQGLKLEKRDVFAILLVVGLMAGLIYYLPRLLPSIFESGGLANVRFAMMSVLG